MKFEISSVDIWHQPEKLLAEYPKLTEFGFESETIERTRIVKIRDEVGNPMWQETPCSISIPYINIDTTEDLLRLIKTIDNPIIVAIEDDGNPSIEIYDGYRE